MVITREDIYRDLLDSLVEILEQEADDIPHDIKRLKSELFRNDREDHMALWCHSLRDDIKTTIENLEEIVKVVDDIEDELNEEKEFAPD